MKVLIGFDSLAASGYIFDDLAIAGLPADTSFLIVSATEIDPFPEEAETSIEDMLKPDSASWQREVSPEERTYLATMLGNARRYAQEKEEETTQHAREGAEELRRRFPSAAVDFRVVMASPFQAIGEQAQQKDVDLIVVGSQNASSLSRFFLGSVSQKVITFSSRPVRIARAQARPSGQPPHILVAFDGSPDSRRTIKSIQARSWPAGTRVTIVLVEEPRSAGFFLRSLSQSDPGTDATAGKLVRNLAEDAAEQLKQAGLETNVEHFSGDPKKILLEKAEQWNVDAIFLGAKGHQHPNTATMGAVATAIATRAHCSLEIVR